MFPCSERKAPNGSRLQTEITQVALGYGLKYKISNYRVQSYLAPAYVVLQRRHPDLSFQAFINEVLRIREEEREKRDPSGCDYKWHGVKAYLDEFSGGSSRVEQARRRVPSVVRVVQENQT